MNKQELGDIITRLALRIAAEERDLPKIKLLEAIVAQFVSGITFSQIALADTFYFHRHSSKRWQALRLNVDSKGALHRPCCPPLLSLCPAPTLVSLPVSVPWCPLKAG